jgi:hypothetical protein
MNKIGFVANQPSDKKNRKYRTQFIEEITEEHIDQVRVTSSGEETRIRKIRTLRKIRPINNITER